VASVRSADIRIACSLWPPTIDLSSGTGRNPCSLLLAPCSLLLPPSSFLLPPSSFLLAPCSLLLAPCSLLLAPCSLLLAPCSLLLAPCSLLLAPCSFSPGEQREEMKQKQRPDFRQPRRRFRLACDLVFATRVLSLLASLSTETESTSGAQHQRPRNASQKICRQSCQDFSLSTIWRSWCNRGHMPRRLELSLGSQRVFSYQARGIIRRGGMNRGQQLA
jgi:hypothetical protein